jgi:glycosyltransferase involved in cell wall biosynthesis
VQRSINSNSQSSDAVVDGTRKSADLAVTQERLAVSAIIPARNEVLCIAAVVSALLNVRSADGRALLDEVVVVDNGSSDGTGPVALAAGARVVRVEQPGYGRACWEGAMASRAEVLLFVDGDGAADAQDAIVLLDAIASGAQLAIGIRAEPDIGAMTFTQRFGNWLACTLMKWVWQMPALDLGPYRAIRRNAFDALDMQDRKFGWTVEMQVRAHLLRLRVSQVPVSWRVRSAGQSKISGTLAGVVGAGFGILGMIARLYWRERQRRFFQPVRRSL